LSYVLIDLGSGVVTAGFKRL